MDMTRDLKIRKKNLLTFCQYLYTVQIINSKFGINAPNESLLELNTTESLAVTCFEIFSWR